MAPSKTPDANVPTSEKSLIWTSKMDDALIESFTHELDMGHKEKPKAAYWRNTPLPNFEKMLALYGNDRATGDEGDTPSNMKKRGISIPPPAHSGPPSPVENEVDPLLSQNNLTFQDFLVNLDDVGVDDHSHGAQGESSKKIRRVGANKVKDTSSEGVLIAEQIQGVVSAMREGNQVFRDRYASQILTSQISGEDTFKLIRKSGCDEDKIPIIYCFLMNDLSKLRTMIQCPLCASKSLCKWFLVIRLAHLLRK
ncbi:hypothetical protein K1719_040088 [Acacia pycnantha]|nr:hypothetical protein K1719_040088 [Acacia pycnantha]